MLENIKTNRKKCSYCGSTHERSRPMDLCDKCLKAAATPEDIIKDIKRIEDSEKSVEDIMAETIKAKETQLLINTFKRGKD